MRLLCAASLFLAYAAPALAQEAKTPVIPIIVGTAQETARISVKVDRGLTSSKRLRSAALRRARAQMQEGEQISPEHLRALALARDGLAAQRYVRHLQNEGGATPSDIAYFAAIAVATGRIWTLKPMIAAMGQLDPKTEPQERINAHIRALYPHAWAGNALALDALVVFNGEGRLFGPLSEATRARILEQAQKQGTGRTEMRMAMAILEAERAKPEPDTARIAQAAEYLKVAAASQHLAVRTTAQNLLRMIEDT